MPSAPSNSLAGVAVSVSKPSDNLIADILLDEQLVLGINRDLDVVAHGDTGMCRHGAAVGVSQRNLVLASSVQFGQKHRVSLTPLTKGRDLLGEMGGPGPANPALLGIALVQAAEIVGQARIRLGHKPGQGGTGEVAVLVVDRLDPGAVHRDQLAPKQVEFAAQQHERAEDLPEGMTVVAAEVGNGFEVRLEVAKQPDHLNVPPRLCL